MAVRIGGKRDHDFNEPMGVLCDCHERIEHFLEVMLLVTQLNQGGPLSPSHRHAPPHGPGLLPHRRAEAPA